MGTSHIFALTGLLPDTRYYYQVQGQNGPLSSMLEFKTPLILSDSMSGSNTVTGPVYISGSTATGMVFSSTGSLKIMSISSSGSSLMFALNGLSIIAPGNNWDGIIQGPEMTQNIVNLTLSGFAFPTPAYQIGNSQSTLTFSGQVANISAYL